MVLLTIRVINCFKVINVISRMRTVYYKNVIIHRNPPRKVAPTILANCPHVNFDL